MNNDLNIDSANSALVVSVVMMCYNCEEYIHQAVSSVLEQETDFRFELILADDCSTDGTREIIANYAASDSRVRAIYNPENLGISRNFASVIFGAQGKYLAFLDPDDFWTNSKKLQKQVDLMESDPSMAICFGSARVFYEDGSKPEEIWPNQYYPDKNFTFEAAIEVNCFNFMTTMVRRLDDYSGYRTDIMPNDHYAWLFHLAKNKRGGASVSLMRFWLHTVALAAAKLTTLRRTQMLSGLGAAATI